jgi:hypothetical protein
MIAVVAAVVAAACGSTTPTPTPTAASPTPSPTAEPTPTPSPTPTPVPTPLPSLPAVDATVFPAGWTVAASTTNVGETPGTKLRSTIGKTYSVVAVCTGEGDLTVTLRATGRPIKNVEGQPPGVDAGSIPLDCPAVDTTPKVFEFTAADDWHGVLIDPQVSAADGVTYTVLVGTHG